MIIVTSWSLVTRNTQMRCFSILAILQVGEHWLKVRTSLIVHTQAFWHVFNTDLTHVTVNHTTMKLTPLGL